MSMTSESDEKIISGGVDSPSIDDANSEGTVGGNGPLKKGPWTSAEDAILVEYVTKHGEGNWNAVQKHSGLARCGKSCRLRWANHLRPNLKKGAFTPEEEHRIIELHAQMGNKWARMAAELPGRTDNEIKNYWNTRIKRRQRAGLPIYPPDICMRTLNENQLSDSMNTFSSGDGNHPDFMPVNNFGIPAVEFKDLELNQQLHPKAYPDITAGSMFNIPANSLLEQGLHSYPNKSLLSTAQPSKRLRGSGPLFPNVSDDGIGNSFAGGSQYQNDGSTQIAQSFFFSSPCDHNSTSDLATPLNLLPGSHAILNGNPSSDPASAVKLELPSLQSQMGTWGLPSPSSPLPFFESADILIQTPPTEQNQSCNLSPQNSGLLDAVLYESETMRNSKSNGCQQISLASDTAFNTMANATHDLHETRWAAYDDPLSPLGHSSSSIFSESTPMSGNSFDEPHSASTFPGCKVKEETGNLCLMQYEDKVETTKQMIFSRPDYLLGSNCFGPMKHPTEDYPLIKDVIGMLDDDWDCNKLDAGATSSTQSHGHDSCAWNAMPSV